MAKFRTGEILNVSHLEMQQPENRVQVRCGQKVSATANQRAGNSATEISRLGPALAVQLQCIKAASRFVHRVLLHASWLQNLRSAHSPVWKILNSDSLPKAQSVRIAAPEAMDRRPRLDAVFPDAIDWPDFLC